MKYIIYQTINTVNNKIYIGIHKTKDPNVFDNYLGCGVKGNIPSSYNDPSTPFQHAVKKYGPSAFKRSTLKVFDKLDDALDLERWLVCKEFVKRKDTYNATLGGQFGSLYFPVNQFDTKGNLIKEWYNIQEAADFYGISGNAICNSIKFKGSCKEYFWNRANSIDVTEYILYTGSRCYKYDIDGNYVETYNSIPEASKDNNIPMQSIQRSIKGGYCAEGFYYSTELFEEFIKIPKISLKNRNIYIYDLCGNYITTLKNGKEIQSFFNITSTSCITTAIRTKRQYRDYQITLEYADKISPTEDKRNKSKKVGQYSLTGDLIQEFDSITKAVEMFGTAVQKVLRGQQQKTQGFIFRYI